MPSTPAAVRWLTPFSCRSSDRVRENSAFKFLTSYQNQYTLYSINDRIPVVKSFLQNFSDFFGMEAFKIWQNRGVVALAFQYKKCYHRPSKQAFSV